MKSLDKLFLVVFPLIILSSCIGDDIIDDRVDPEIRITNLIDTIELNSQYQFEASYFNNVGLPTSVGFSYSSTDDSIISISLDGLATALAIGDATIIVEVDENGARHQVSFDLVVGTSTSLAPIGSSRSGQIVSSSFYVLEGGFEIEKTDDGQGITINIDESYKASSSLPGLYLYLSNNRNSIAGALEIGAVQVFQGAHNYEVQNVAITDFNYLLYFCKPFNVKVGDGKIE